MKPTSDRDAKAMTTVTGKRVCVVGDNCVDIVYGDTTREYPGGNAVNTAVALSRTGCSVGIVSVIGTDERGTLIRDTLRREGVDTTRLKIVEGRTAWTEVKIEHGERVFLDDDLGVQKSFDIDDDDRAHLSRFDWVHHTAFTNWPSASDGEMTDYYRRISRQVSEIHGVVPDVSVDFSDREDRALLSALRGLVDIGFFSRRSMNEAEALAHVARLRKYHIGTIILTMGEHGSRGFDGSSLEFQRAVPVETVSTLGAGDAFIGAYLSRHLEKADLRSCLEAAAEYAADVCKTASAFG